MARALEMVGERWGMLIVRDLILGPKRFTELQQGLAKISTSILSARLNELEASGVVRRRVLPQLDAAVVYELTEYGAELEGILLQLGLWGARSLGEPAEGEQFTRDSAILSLYTTFRPEYAEGVQLSYELHFGPMVLHALIDDGGLKVAEGGYTDADLVIWAYGSIRPLLAGEMTTQEALDHGLVSLTGDRHLFDRFVDFFPIPAAPQLVEGVSVR
ncbi:MAG TPA: helix-turn-helix domain-containing protein [Pilimelia sp.]|nr:helix-turn-helix domain-containing protein [Pilimelia sp.]